MKSQHLPLILTYAVLLAVLIIFSSFITADAEELLHYNCLSIQEAWHTAKLSYLHMNPRIGEMSAYFLGRNAPAWIMLINTGFSFACILFIYRLGVGTWPTPDTRTIFILLFCFVTLMGFATGITWVLGNLSWLYPCTCALGLFCIIERFFYGDFHLSWKKTLLALLLAIITGMSNNNTPAIAWVLVAGCCAYWCFIKKKSFPTWQYLLILLTLTVSCTLFYLAPGTYERAKVANWELSFSNILWNSVLSINNWIFTAIIFWRLIAGLLLFLLAKKLVHFRIERTRVFLLSFTFFCLWGILILAPCWGAPRSYLPLELMTACILTHLYARFVHAIGLKKTIPLLLLYTAIMATNFVPMIGGLVSSAREWNRIEAMAQKVKSQGGEVLVVHKSDLDFTPAFPRIWKLPASVFDYRVSPTIPLITCSEDQCHHSNHQHKWIETTWVSDSGDHIMNPIAAKKLGLKAVYYLSDK